MESLIPSEWYGGNKGIYCVCVLGGGGRDKVPAGINTDFGGRVSETGMVCTAGNIQPMAPE